MDIAMLGYCPMVHATAHIMSQIIVKHLGNYNLSLVNKWLTRACADESIGKVLTVGAAGWET